MGRFVVPAIEEAFVAMVRKNGRLTESRMGIKVAAKSGLRSALGMVPIAWKLWRKGRLRLLRVERMQNPESLRGVLAAVEDRRPAPPRTGPPSAFPANTTPLPPIPETATPYATDSGNRRTPPSPRSALP